MQSPSYLKEQRRCDHHLAKCTRPSFSVVPFASHGKHQLSHSKQSSLSRRPLTQSSGLHWYHFLWQRKYPPSHWHHHFFLSPTRRRLDPIHHLQLSSLPSSRRLHIPHNYSSLARTVNHTSPTLPLQLMCKSFMLHLAPFPSSEPACWMMTVRPNVA